jgi:fructose-bisphosphate aldolase, class II
MEGIIATVRACEALKSPGMILLFPWAQQYSTLGLATLASHMARNAKVPVTLHLDHAQSDTAVKTAADSGCYDSIMVDMSHYDKEENLARTTALTQYCHERGIAVEAEPGRIEGGEDGVGDTGELEALMTDADEAGRFADTGIDWLAPAFGNVHGNYGPRGPQLDYDRLHMLKREVGARLRFVLHGTDGFDQDILAKCIAGGMVKININRAVNRHWKTAVKEEGTLTGLIEQATTKMQEEVEWWIRALGSEGKA